MREELLEDIFEFIRNGASIKQSAGKGGCPITRIETIWNRTIDTERFGYADLSDEGINAYEKYLMKNGDILMSHINSPKHLGKCAIYNGQPDRLIHGMNLLSLRADQAVSFPKYLNFYFNSNYFKVQLIKISNQSVNQASFSSGKLKKLTIPLPPLDQQKKIAAILDAADAYRQKTKALITKYEELTQSLFLDMFGDPVRNPMGWDEKSFENIAMFDTNMTKDFERYGDLLHVGIGNIKKNTGKIYGCISAKEEGVISGKYLFNDKHIIYSKIRPNLNKVALPDFEGLCSADSYPLLPINGVSNRIYIAFLLRSNCFVDFILKHSTRTNMPKANRSQMKLFKGICPPIELQSQFAERIQAIEEQKAQAQGSLAQAKDLFNSLLQKAFKGELV